MSEALAVPKWMPEDGRITKVVENILTGGTNPNDHLAWDQLKEAYRQADLAEQATQWFKAQICYTAKVVFGESAVPQFADELGVSEMCIRQYVKAYEAFNSIDSRREELTYSHHLAAAYTPDPHRWIEKAVEDGLSVPKMREEIARERRALAARTEPGNQTTSLAVREDIERYVKGALGFLSSRDMAEFFIEELIRALRSTDNIGLASRKILEATG